MYTSIYNPNRQFQFIKRQAILFQQRWYIAAGAIFGLMLLISLLTAYFYPYNINGVLNMYYVVLFIGGLIFTSQMFMELHSPNQAYAFLTLPVSTLEKLLGSWFISSPLYLLVYTAATYLIYLLSTLITGFEISPLDYFSESYWNTVGSYLVMQTLFLWGACYFRKSNFLKTVLVTIVFSLALGIYSGLLGWMLFGANFQGNVNVTDSQPLQNFMENYYAPVSEFLFWGVFGPYLLVTAYFTLKERQL